MTNENTTFRPLDSLQVMAYIVDSVAVWPRIPENS